MSDPVITNYGGAFIYYTCDRDPTDSEPLVYNNYGDLFLLWWNQSNNTFWTCIDDISDSMIWQQIASISDISSAISALGWEINTTRNYSPRSTPAFNTNYTPSVSNDTFVLATVNITLSILQSSTITAQVDTGSGFVTIATAASGAVAINNTSTLSFIVPKGATYKIVSGGNGINTLNSIMELSM